MVVELVMAVTPLLDWAVTVTVTAQSSNGVTAITNSTTLALTVQ